MEVRNVHPGSETLPPNSPLRDSALRLVLSGDTRCDSDVEQRISTLRQTVSAQGINLDLIAVARTGDRLTAAGLAIESPGRTAMVHLSPLPESDTRLQAWLAVLEELRYQAPRRGIALLQAMVLQNEAGLETVLAQAGFQFLAELIYAERLREGPAPPQRHEPELDLATYCWRQHNMFLRALEDSYANSSDCPGLAGIRRTEDVLAGHRATGRHDPSLWFLARLQGQIAGILLLSPVRNRNMLEVVYMGVAHRFRRCGFGHALMRKCHGEMMKRNFSGVILAVDSVNSPARTLYSRWGFAETGRRRAWIAATPD